MEKGLILSFLIFGILGATPEFLTSSESFRVEAPDGAVETVLAEEEVEETEEAKAAIAKAPEAGVASQPTQTVSVATVPSEPANNIKITGRTLEIVDVADTATDAGTHVNRYGGKFLYGHNSSAVFGGLASTYVGQTFSVMTNGVTENYQIAQIVIFEKNGNRLQLDGSGSYMNSVAKARFQGVDYDLSIMTCHGASLGNGDATERLVIFANKI